MIVIGSLLASIQLYLSRLVEEYHTRERLDDANYKRGLKKINEQCMGRDPITEGDPRSFVKERIRTVINLLILRLRISQMKYQS